MNIGDKAPEVLGMNENGEEIRLSQYKGKKLVLYFYPKDNTSGCTAEACSLRDNYAELRKQGYEVIGVSVDDAASHRKFIDKHGLPFPLIADTDKTGPGHKPGDANTVSYVNVRYVSQNVYLYCASAGIGSRARGGWNQQKVVETLKLKDSMIVVLGQTVGYCE